MSLAPRRNSSCRQKSHQPAGPIAFPAIEFGLSFLAAVGSDRPRQRLGRPDFVVDESLEIPAGQLEHVCFEVHEGWSKSHSLSAIGPVL